MIEYTAKDGDMLDWICWRHYGRAGLVPEVLAANPGLERLSARIPAGTVVVLPDLPPPPAPAPRRLWD